MDFIDLKSQYRALREPINARIQRVLDHGPYIMGPEVKELEEKLAAYTGARHCITVASGSEALLVALMALGIKPGDEVYPVTERLAREVLEAAGARRSRRSDPEQDRVGGERRGAGHCLTPWTYAARNSW
jgi:UDP-2-acetamido-2-deoxy-ribo-hexuluronate aminotransferase